MNTCHIWVSHKGQTANMGTYDISDIPYWFSQFKNRGYTNIWATDGKYHFSPEISRM